MVILLPGLGLHVKQSQSYSVSRFELHFATLRSTQTAKLYGYAARAFLDWLAERGIRSIDQAPLSVLQDYTSELLQSYQPSSAKVKIVGVQRYLEWCRARGLNVPLFLEPDLPRPYTKMRDVLDQHGLVKFMEATSKLPEPERTALRLLPGCGLRVEELAALRLDDLRMASVPLKDGQSRDYLVLRVRGKGRKERMVPVLDESKAAVEKYMPGWRKNFPDERWLFPSLQSSSGHITGRQLRYAVEELREPLGVQFTPHTFRRTYLTELYRRGVEPVLIAKIAGHSSIETLIRHYLAIDHTDVVRAVHKTGGRLFGG